MMLRQEGALDRSIDRKVRILMRLRKELSSPPITPTDQDKSAGMESSKEVLMSDNARGNTRIVEAEDLKMNDRRGNVIENKGSRLDHQGPGANVMENKTSYARDPGMSLKTEGLIGNAELYGKSESRNQKLENKAASF
jgi:hypothetical protein